MLGMGEPTKQNGEERRARLGVKPLNAAVPDENVQRESMRNISQAGRRLPAEIQKSQLITSCQRKSDDAGGIRPAEIQKSQLITRVGPVTRNGKIWLGANGS